MTPWGAIPRVRIWREDWTGTLGRLDRRESGGQLRRCKFHQRDPEPATTTSPVSSRNLLPVWHLWLRVYAFVPTCCVREGLKWVSPAAGLEGRRHEWGLPAGRPCEPAPLSGLFMSQLQRGQSVTDQAFACPNEQ